METGQYPHSASLNGKQNGNGKHLQTLPLIYQTPLHETDTDDLNLRQLLTIARRRALVIATVAIAVTSVVGFSTLKKIPQYESKFQLLVEPVTLENKLTRLTQGAEKNLVQDSSLDYETQIQVLRSPKLMSPIIEVLKARYPDISYDSLISSNQLKINRLGETKILEISYEDADPKKVKSVLHEVARGYLRYSFEERQINVSQGIRFVEGQLPKLEQRVDKLQAQLQSFRQRYNLLDPENQAKELSTRVSGIEQQRLDSLIKLNETRSLYSTLQQQLGLAPNQAIATAALSEAPRYQMLLNQLQEVETKIAAESARFTEDSPTIQVLRDQQRNLLPLLRKEAAAALGPSVYQPGVLTASPNSIRLNLTQQLVEAANQIRVLEVRTTAIGQAETRINQEVRQLPVIARQYTDLQRQLNIATESLTRFLGVQETLQIEAAQKALPWQLILVPKQPEVPIPLNNERSLILGGFAGLLLGMGAALLIEKLDNVFHSPDELKNSTGLPLLGVIPFQKQLKTQTPMAKIGNYTSAETHQPKSRNRRQPNWYNASPFLESFRSLHTNIRFLGSDTPIHSLVISSATPAEGKSTTSVHLAQAAAAMGQRVLLIDADLRRPQVHHVLGLENSQGLSNVIATELNPKQAIQRLPMWDHLYVLTAGQIPPDPTRLLCSKKMKYLMEQFNAVFDLVIYDTPPVLGLADGKLLAAHTDGIVMVVGLGKTERSLLVQALDGLKTSSATVLGVVANGVKGYTTSSYHYYDRYYTSASDMEKARKFFKRW